MAIASVQTGRSWVRYPMESLGFLFDLMVAAALCPWVDSASKGNGYQWCLFGNIKVAGA